MKTLLIGQADQAGTIANLQLDNAKLRKALELSRDILIVYNLDKKLTNTFEVIVEALEEALIQLHINSDNFVNVSRMEETIDNLIRDIAILEHALVSEAINKKTFVQLQIENANMRKVLFNHILIYRVDDQAFNREDKAKTIFDMDMADEVIKGAHIEQAERLDIK